MPHLLSLGEPRRRGIAHHIMANHELQALEVMAFVLRAFPEAPSEFRLGLARVMCDEQRHTRLHAERGAELGVPFGSLPVNGYFWIKAQEFAEVLDYLAGLPLTFEGGNLDHTLEFEAAFREAGDTRGGTSCGPSTTTRLSTSRLGGGGCSGSSQPGSRSGTPTSPTCVGHSVPRSRAGGSFTASRGRPPGCPPSSSPGLKRTIPRNPPHPARSGRVPRDRSACDRGWGGDGANSESARSTFGKASHNAEALATSAPPWHASVAEPAGTGPGPLRLIASVVCRDRSFSQSTSYSRDFSHGRFSSSLAAAWRRFSR